MSIKIAEVRDNDGVDQAGDSGRWEISGNTHELSIELNLE